MEPSGMHMHGSPFPQQHFDPRTRPNPHGSRSASQGSLGGQVPRFGPVPSHIQEAGAGGSQHQTQGMYGQTLTYEEAVMHAPAKQTMEERMLVFRRQQDLLAAMHRNRQMQRASMGLPADISNRPSSKHLSRPTPSQGDNPHHLSQTSSLYQPNTPNVGGTSSRGQRGPRGPYMCGFCQVPKAGHQCPLEYGGGSAARGAGGGGERERERESRSNMGPALGIGRRKRQSDSEEEEDEEDEEEEVEEEEMMAEDAEPEPCTWHNFELMHYLGDLDVKISPEWLSVSKSSPLTSQVIEFISKHGHMDFDMQWLERKGERPGPGGVPAMCVALVGADDVSEGTLQNLHADAQDLVTEEAEVPNTLLMIQNLPILNVSIYNLLKAGWIRISTVLRAPEGLTLGRHTTIDKLHFRMAIFFQRPALDYCDDPYLVKRRKNAYGVLDREVHNVVTYLMAQTAPGLALPRWGNGSLENPQYDTYKPPSKAENGDESNRVSVDELYDLIQPPADSPEMDTPEGLACKLTKWQRQALEWMYHQETVVPQIEQEVHPLWRPLALAPGSEVKWVYVNMMVSTFTAKRFPPVMPEPGGVLASDPGLGKTVTFLSLALANPRTSESDDRSRSRQLIDEMKSTLKPLSAKTSLIITAHEYVDQWVDEAKRLAPKLSVAVYRGMDANEAWPHAEISRLDLLVTSYKSLRGDLRLSTEDSPSPLLGVQFWRVVLDEPQTQGLPLHKVSEMAGELWRVNGWYLTGSLIQRSLKDIHGPLCFLDSDPFADAVVLQEVLLKPYACGDQYARHALPALLKKIAWKHCYRHVSDQFDQLPDGVRPKPPPTPEAMQAEDASDKPDESYEDRNASGPFGGRKARMRQAQEERAMDGEAKKKKTSSSRKAPSSFGGLAPPKKVVKRKHDNGLRTCRTRFKDQKDMWCSACKIKKACTDLQVMPE